MKIEIKNRWNGEVIFTHEAENNSWKIAVEAAIEAGADLSRANLSDANLSGADLSGADLANANLSDAHLSGADLSDAEVDFSSGWRFACSCSRFKVSVKFAYQVLAHLCSCKSDDPEFSEIREKVMPYALKSHRAGDLGLLNGDAGEKNASDKGTP